MTDPNSSDEVVRNLKIGTARSTDVHHFTGGLVAFPIEGGGLGLGPVIDSDRLRLLGPMSFPEVCEVAKHAGCFYVGMNQINLGSGPERSEFWYPNLGATDGAVEQSSDLWSFISYHARKARDGSTEDLAKYVSFSMKFAGFRLREVSKLHTEQLEWALISKRNADGRFANVALFDIHMAIHSLVAELCAARDYLARIAAIRVGANSDTDSLARLLGWLKKPGRIDAMNDPFIQLFLRASGGTASPGWLPALGEMRNQFMHRQPIAASKDAATMMLRHCPTARGRLTTIRLSPYRHVAKKPSSEDVAITLLRFWLSMEALCRDAARLMRYPTHPPVLRSE